MVRTSPCIEWGKHRAVQVVGWANTAVSPLPRGAVQEEGGGGLEGLLRIDNILLVDNVLNPNRESAITHPF